MSSVSGAGFTDADREQLSRRGLAPDDAERQLRLLSEDPHYARLVRPATIGDGVRRVPAQETSILQELHAEAARSGRLVKFTPASGAASRMFQELFHFQRGPGRRLSWTAILEQQERGVREAETLVTVVRELERFAFFGEMRRILGRNGEDVDGLIRIGAFQVLLDTLLGEGGMAYAQLPKGLLEFHRYEAGSRTAFEEHLVEAAHYSRDGAGASRLHFTVSPEHIEAFRMRFRRVEDEFRERYDTRFDIDYSVQDPATDTLAVDSRQSLVRDDQGRLRFRPGGHGALIANLNNLSADLVFVKNIDNVQPDRLKASALEWKRTLAGYLIRLQDSVFEQVHRLRKSSPPPEHVEGALQFVQRELNVEIDPDQLPTGQECRRAFALARLNRPLRVCGVVPNTGEPGGGPFWVRGQDDTTTLQIVETAQVDPDDGDQQAVLGSATHFNPVDLVCATRDVDGHPFDLTEFVDPDLAIVSKKSDAGNEMRVLERPGLWNGAMAGWNTAFVEVPIETFSPVKSLLDLLRDEHQPEAARGFDSVHSDQGFLD